MNEILKGIFIESHKNIQSIYLYKEHKALEETFGTEFLLSLFCILFVFVLVIGLCAKISSLLIFVLIYPGAVICILSVKQSHTKYLNLPSIDYILKFL